MSGKSAGASSILLDSRHVLTPAVATSEDTERGFVEAIDWWSPMKNCQPNRILASLYTVGRQAPLVCELFFRWTNARSNSPDPVVTRRQHRDLVLQSQSHGGKIRCGGASWGAQAKSICKGERDNVCLCGDCLKVLSTTADVANVSASPSNFFCLVLMAGTTTC